MNILFIYMLKTAVYMITFYLVYLLLLSRDTSYARNRAFIMISVIASVLLPLVTLHTAKPLNIQFFGKFLSEMFITSTAKAPEAISTGKSFPDILEIIYITYIIVATTYLFKVLIDLLILLFLIIRHKEGGSRIIRFNGFHTSGFSTLGYIFINARLSPEDAGNIIRHEQNHLKKYHFIDIIFIEVVKAFQWFNPVIYLYNRSLRAIHEYQADRDCLDSGIPIVNYQSLLISQVFKSGAFNTSNSFANPSLIKKRMVMMTKKRTSSIAGIKLLIAVPVAGMAFLAISAYSEISPSGLMIQPEISDNNTVSEGLTGEPEQEPFVVVEEMPMFPGGESALNRFLAENTKYPETAKSQSIQGKVIIRFCILPDGHVNKISVLRGVVPALDAEAVRVVSSLPAFIPGRQGGKPVPVWFIVPIVFVVTAD